MKKDEKHVENVNGIENVNTTFFVENMMRNIHGKKKINIEKLTLIQIHSNVMFFQAKDRTKILFLKGFPDAFLHK